MNTTPLSSTPTQEDLMRAHKKNTVRLMPRYPFRVWGHDTDLQRFARVFRKMWYGIPLYERRRLLTYWRALSFYPDFEPRFSILPYLSSRGEDLRALGVCFFHNNSFEFHTDAVNLMPDDILSILIAHELAHVAFRLQWKEDAPEMFRNRLFLFWEDEPEKEGEGQNDVLSWRWQEEMHTRELCECWGFSDDDLEEWLTGNRAKLKDLEAQREAELQQWILEQKT